ELPPSASARSPVLAHLERALFGEAAAPAPESDGSLRFLEGAGLRGTLELVAEEILGLLRTGTPPEEIGVVCPSLDRWRGALDTAFSTLGVPYALEGPVRLGQIPFGQALLALLRYAWLDGDRRDLFSFLRSPYSGLTRAHADFLEGRLRGRGVSSPARVEEEVQKLRGQPLPHLEQLRAAENTVAAVETLARVMLRAAYGLESPPTHEQARLDLRAHERIRRLLAELERWPRRRPLAALTWPLEAAPSQRERLRALGSLAATEEGTAQALARANGWERRLERALAAFERPTRLTHPAVLEELRQKASFSVTDLERLADCSSLWLIDRVASPRTMAAAAYARLRGTAPH